MRIHYLLNIGLALPGSSLTLDAPTAAKAAAEYLLALSPDEHTCTEEWVVHTSDTEPTLVLSVTGPSPYSGDLAALALLMKQESIVFCRARSDWSPLLSTGDLFGPKAAEWGPFNPAFFILPNGQRAA